MSTHKIQMVPLLGNSTPPSLQSTRPLLAPNASLLKNCARQVFACAKEHFEIVVGNYLLDIDRVTENDKHADEKIQAILIRFFIHSGKAVLERKDQLKQQIGEKDFFLPEFQEVFNTSELVWEAKKLTVEVEMVKSLLELSRGLRLQGRFCGAKEVGLEIPDNKVAEALDPLAESLIMAQRIPEGVDVINQIPRPELRDPTFHKVSVGLAKQEPFEENAMKWAIKIAHMILNLELRSSSLSEITQVLIKEKRFSSADNVANEIPNNAMRETVKSIITASSRDTEEGCLPS
jgi:hypothetical protein